MSILFSGSAVIVSVYCSWEGLLLLFWGDVCVLVLIILDCCFILSVLVYRGMFRLIAIGGIFGMGRSGGLRFVCLLRFVLGVGRSGGLHAGWFAGLFVGYLLSDFGGMCLIMMLFIFCFFSRLVKFVMLMSTTSVSMSLSWSIVM